MSCRVKNLLDRFHNGDREQLEILIADRTRSPEMIARGFHEYDPDLTGTDVRKHQHATCDCHGWVD